MARYGSDVVAFLVSTASTTAAYHNLGGYIQEISGLNIEAMLQETHGFGDAWVEQGYTGMRRGEDITVQFFYDDVAASGPHAVLGALTTLGAERHIKWKFGTTNEYPKTPVVVRRYARLPRRGELTGVECVFALNGTVTIGTT